MAVPVWKSYGKYSGPTILGKVSIPSPTTGNTLDRQHWLTMRVETGATYGSVVMFDGTAVTAGADQFILVYPKELANEDLKAADDQGPLGKLVARLCAIQDVGMQPPINALLSAFAAAGWTLSPVGELRYSKAQSVALVGRKIQVNAGELVHGAVLRDTVTPVGGAVPKAGVAWQQSAKWCQLFHELFVHPAGYSTQSQYGREHLVKAYRAPRLKIAPKSVEMAVFGRDVSAVKIGECGPELDLAMGVWYSNSVNAPAIALSCLERALVGGKGADFPRRLIRELGISTYGRWNAMEPNGRYQRTRRLALASNLWPRALFEGRSAIMPADLEQAVG
jgi:hypothetical protein